MDLEAPFAAVQLISLDDAPIAKSEHLLLVATARVANTGMVWQDEDRHTLGAEMGSEPTRIEPVTGTLRFHDLGDVQGLTVTPLDGCGQPMDESWTLAPDALTLTLDGEPATLWYDIRVERA
jgi:hypothetical protein